jgi:hypothetical protein
MAVPVVRVSLLEPVWQQFAVLVPPRPVLAATHPLGCHRRHIPDRVVFEHVAAALVHGSGYERIATPGCSDRTIRRRVREWAETGAAQTLHRLIVDQYDRMIGLELDDVAVDGCITKAPGGGEKAGRSPVDRGKQDLKRSILSEGAGIPLHDVAAGANRHDAPLLGPTLAGLAALGPLPPKIARPPRSRLRRRRHARAARPPRSYRRQRRQGRARAAPSREALGGRAHPLVDERLRQAEPLHRAQRARG